MTTTCTFPTCGCPLNALCSPLSTPEKRENARLKRALAVAMEFLLERADAADDTGPNAEMKCLSEIAGIMEGNY